MVICFLVILAILLGAGLYVFERIVGMIVTENGKAVEYPWKDRKGFRRKPPSGTAGESGGK